MENGILISVRGSTWKDQARVNLNGPGVQFQILVGTFYLLFIFMKFMLIGFRVKIKTSQLKVHKNL